jgi:hypothetical protein
MTDPAISRYDHSQNSLRQAAATAWNDLTVSAADGRQRIIELSLWNAVDTSAQHGAHTALADAVCAGKSAAAQLPARATTAADDHRQLLFSGSADASNMPEDSETVLAQAVALAPPQTAPVAVECVHSERSLDH